MPGRDFLLAGLALLGGALIYLAISGRYVHVGAALGSIPILPSGGLSIAGSVKSPSTSSGTSDPANRQA